MMLAIGDSLVEVSEVLCSLGQASANIVFGGTVPVRPTAQSVSTAFAP